MAVLNQMAVRRAIGYVQEIKKTFVIPFICSVLMSLVSYGVYALVLLAIPNERIAVLPALVVAVPLYFVLLIVFKGITERELKRLPAGSIIVKIFKRIHMI